MNKVLKSLIRSFLSRKIKPRKIKGGALKGQWIVTSWYDYPAALLGRTERSLLAWFDSNVKTSETWLDIGAHYGYTSIALSRLVGPQGRVFAFEPMITTAGYLNQTRSLNRFSQLTVLPLALGSARSLELKNLPTDRGMVDSTLGQSRINKGTCVETIFVVQLDWLWPQICGETQKIDGVKIDVQGMEFEVLRGMCGILRNQHPTLIVEFHEGVNRREVLQFIRSDMNYRKVLSIEPELEGLTPMYLDNHSYVFCPS
jgi:FkbM family methyltransferase